MTASTPSTSKPEFSFIPAFEAETSLNQYGSNRLSVFALSMHLGIEDIHQFAADAITDGGDDKKLDICYLNLNESRLVIAQSYFPAVWNKPAAPANKASDLNTAIAWLFSSSEDDLPPNLRSRATDVRHALQRGEITEIDIYYIHNCYESDNVDNELKTCANAAKDLLQIYQHENEIIVIAKEIGLSRIQELYEAQDRDILIDEWLEVPISEYVQESGDKWSAIIMTVPATWIQNLHRKHEERLFSANYRDYLGANSRRGNINHGITQSAEKEPSNFLVYNNGITALTYQLQINDLDGIKIRGISIINGAQTTGALSAVNTTSLENAKVLLRIVECNEPEIIHKIIQYNNTQNEIKAADRRSNDLIQHQLHKQFEYFGIAYSHRRGKQPTRNSITITNIAAALCAFHGDPQTAYRHANEIFEFQSTYNNVFPSDRITADHIFLVRALSLALDNLKISLRRKYDNDTAIDIERDEHELLKYSASRFFILFIVGFLHQEIMYRRINDLFNWKPKPELISVNNHSLMDAWTEVLEALMPLLVNLLKQKGGSAFYEVPRSENLSQEIANNLKAVVSSIANSLETRFYEIRHSTVT